MWFNCLVRVNIDNSTFRKDYPTFLEATSPDLLGQTIYPY